MTQTDLIKSLITTSLQDAVNAAIEKLIVNRAIYLNNEFVPIEYALKKYNFSLTSAKNYHRRGLIRLRRLDANKRGKLYISLIELEEALRKNPINNGAND